MEISSEGAGVLAASGGAGRLLLSLREGAGTRILLAGGAGPPEEVGRINEHLNEIQPPAVRKISYVLNDPVSRFEPRVVEACLMLPAGYDDTRTYPLLMEVYPTGTAGRCSTLADTPKFGVAPEDLWTSRGFIYVRPAFPLDLASRPDDPLGGLGNLVDQTIDALAEYGSIDPGRVVIFGFSQGGAAALVTAVQSQKPAAVISMNGWANYLSHYFGARGLMRYFHLDQNGGDNRWRYECAGEGQSHLCPFGFAVSALEDPGRYALASPVSRASEVSAPIMLIHSDSDYFDMSQYDEMFGALYRAGREAIYVRYWGEGHGPSSPANIRDLWERMDRFLNEAGITESAAAIGEPEDFPRSPARLKPISDVTSSSAARPQ